MTEPLTALSRVRLTPEARANFPDIGARDGVVLRMDGYVVVQWRGSEAESRIRPDDLEPVE